MLDLFEKINYLTFPTTNVEMPKIACNIDIKETVEIVR
jgi:hypothetical protein